MKKLSKYITLFMAAATLTIASPVWIISGEEAAQNITLNAEDTLLAENSDFTLSITGKTLNIKLFDKRTDKLFETNSEENNTDPVATGENLNLLKSHIYLKYYDLKANLQTMSSYTECVAKNQYTLYKLANGISIEYRFGDETKGVESIPQKISEKRFKSKLLNKLSAEDKKTMQSFYKYYSSEKTWMVTSAGRNNFEEILKLLNKAGYTTEDLLQDKMDYGYTADSIKKPSFKVTVNFILTDKGISVSIPTEKIVMSKDFKITEIGLLENFCISKGTKEQSYLFVPDGSGALIDLSTAKNNKKSLSLSVYGIDKTIKASKSSFNIYPPALPVFGIKNGTDSGMLGIIEEGEANAVINAYKAGNRNNQNSVFASFKVINMDYVYIAGTSLMSGVPTFQTEYFKGTLKVLYMPLTEENDYSAMANKYRSYLKEQGALSGASKTGDIPLFLETLGGVSGYKSFLGISYVGIKKATSFKEDIEILQDLKNAGISNVNLKLTGWFNNGVRHDYPAKIKITGILGGKKDLKKLTQYASENQIKLFPDVDFVSAYTNTNGFSPTFTAAKTLDFSSAEIFDTSYVTGSQRRSNGLKTNKRYVVSPAKYHSLVTSFLKAFQPIKIDGISLRSTGNELYSDYKKDRNLDRSTVQSLVTDTLKQINEHTKNVMVNYGNAYTFKYASCINNVPLSNSWFDFTDESVPFYQMVIHGSIDYSGAALNLVTDSKEEMLKHIEYGAVPYYQITYEKSSVLNNSEMYTNFSSCYFTWEQTIKETYQTVNKALSAVQGIKMVKHEKLAENVYKTTYENGVAVYVNYSDREQLFDGITIEPNWYKTAEVK